MVKLKLTGLRSLKVIIIALVLCFKFFYFENNVQDIFSSRKTATHFFLWHRNVLYFPSIPGYWEGWLSNRFVTERSTVFVEMGCWETKWCTAVFLEMGYGVSSWAAIWDACIGQKTLFHLFAHHSLVVRSVISWSYLENTYR